MTLNVYITTILDNIVACATPKTVALLRQYLYACTRNAFCVSICTFEPVRCLDYRFAFTTLSQRLPSSQFLYFCTRNASKMRARRVPRSPERTKASSPPCKFCFLISCFGGAHATRLSRTLVLETIYAFSVSICTFVPVKQVVLVGYSPFWGARMLLACRACATPTKVQILTQKAFLVQAYKY
jgi:hypothetical protein